MQQHRFSFPARSSLALPPAAVGSVLIIYILLTVGLAFLTGLSPLLALIGACGINLIALLWVIMSARFKNWFVLLIPFVLVLPLLFLTPVGDFFDPSKVYGFDRLTMFQDAFNIWQRHPFLGVGAGNYQFFDIAYGTDSEQSTVQQKTSLISSS